MEVVAMPIVSPHDSWCTSYQLQSAPSSPRMLIAHGAAGDHRFFYASAPASPSSSARINGSFSSYADAGVGDGGGEEEAFDFAYGFGGGGPMLADADELFGGGWIRHGAPKSAKDDDRTAAVVQEESRATAAPSKNRRGSRSLSPSPRNFVAARDQQSGSKKWSLKDLFLFRSASEGRAIGRGNKDPLRKYTASSPSPSVLRSAGDGSGSSRRRSSSGPAAAYTANRAAAEEMRKRTPLPVHRNSLFGYLRSNATILGLSRRFAGSSSRSPST